MNMKKKYLVLLFVFAFVLLAGSRVFADATNNPIFATIVQVKQMIAEAVGEPQIVPPLTITNVYAVISSGSDENHKILSAAAGNILLAGQDVSSQRVDTWAIIHLPTGDKYVINDADFGGGIVVYDIESSQLPPPGEPVSIDVYFYFAGKNIHANVNAEWL